MFYGKDHTLPGRRGGLRFRGPGGADEELFRNALEHGRKFHGMKEIPKDLQEKMRKLIREEKAA
jgi:predicted small metal-binding protein